MKIIINPFDINNAMKILSNSNNNFIYLGIEKFSERMNCILNITDLKKIALINSERLFLNMNTFIYEDNLDELTLLLIDLKKNGIKNIMFNDFSIKQISDENNLDFNLVYFSETLNVNSNQIDFFKKNKINHIVLSREIFKNNLINFNRGQLFNVQMQVDGYSFIMQSRWKLISNFCDINNLNKNELINKKLYIKENLRKLPNIIFEDENNSYLFSGFNLSLINKLDFLFDNGINFIRIDSFMHNANWVDKTLELYNQAVNILLNNKEEYLCIKNELFNKIKKINEAPTSNGFLSDNISDIMHTIKNNDEVDNDQNW